MVLVPSGYEQKPEFHVASIFGISLPVTTLVTKFGSAEKVGLDKPGTVVPYEMNVCPFASVTVLLSLAILNGPTGRTTG